LTRPYFDFFEGAFVADVFLADDLRAGAFFVAVFLAGDFLGDVFFLGIKLRVDEVLLEEDFLAGTLPPARRASESPMAIACLRLFTFFPEPPLRSVSCLRSCIAFSTFDCAFFPYRAIIALLHCASGQPTPSGAAVHV